MQYNEETDKNDIVNDVYFWTGANSVSYAIEDLTRNANRALDMVVAIIMRVSKKWKYDDTNNTDMPIGTIDLVVGQRDYPIDSEHLKIKKVRVKDGGGYWNTLTPIRIEDVSDSLEQETNGLPAYYVKNGNSLLLYPKAASGSVTTTSGLEVTFQRGATYFTITDTTETPGFAIPFHRLVSLYTSQDYGFLPVRKSAGELLIAKLEKELEEFYGERDDDNNNCLGMGEISFR